MVEQDVDTLVHVVDLGLEGLRGDGFDAGDFGGQEVDDWLGVGWDVRTVAAGVLGFTAAGGGGAGWRWRGGLRLGRWGL